MRGSDETFCGLEPVFCFFVAGPAIVIEALNNEAWLNAAQ
jgi:hypothetical protein